MNAERMTSAQRYCRGCVTLGRRNHGTGTVQFGSCAMPHSNTVGTAVLRRNAPGYPICPDALIKGM